MCEHEGFYTCVGRYDRGAGRLVYVMVCDDCHQVLNTVAEQPYQPRFVDRTWFDAEGGVSPQPA